MKNKKYSKEMLRQERIETLLLMSVLAQEPYRTQAAQELARRQVVKTEERLFNAFMLLS